MASPFPGMDPYLENPAHWSDFHATFIMCCRDTLTTSLPAHYTARIGERVYLVAGPPWSRKLISPDVAIERQLGPTAAFPSGAGTATAALRTPVTIPLVAVDDACETYIEILHRSDRSLVTSIELLSPANKEEPGRSLYLAKRNALLAQKVHVVELDLLLSGQRLPMRAPIPEADYHAFVARAEARPDCDVYSWMLPDPLPVLPIPLRAPDPPVMLALGAVFAIVYERGTYQREIDYALPPPARVSEERQSWIAGCIQSARG